MSDESPEKTVHALKLLTSLRKLRRKQIICDFTIKVGDVTIRAHRAILAACSDYFEAMFVSNMKEVKEGIVDMKDVDADAVKQCVEFMYTGEAKVTGDNAQNILHASGLMQLDGLTEICFKYLQKNLTVENCLSIKHLAETYHCRDAIKASEQFITENFEAVTKTENFSELNKEDFLNCLRLFDKNPTVLWNGVISWIEYDMEERKDHFLDILKPLMEKLPFKFLIETVRWNDIVREMKPCFDFVIESLFSDLWNLKKNLDAENCFEVRSLVKEFKKFEMVKKVVDNYMVENFSAIVEKKQFGTLDKTDITMLLQSEGTIILEVKKWHAVVNWIGYNYCQRKHLFPEFFALISLDRIPLNFIQTTIKNERLVMESHACKDLIIDHLFARATARENMGKKGNLAVLNNNTGRISVLNLRTNTWEALLNIHNPLTCYFKKIISLNEELYLLINDKLFWHSKENGTVKIAEAIRPTLSGHTVAFQGCIYSVEGSYMWALDPVKMVVHNDLPPCHLSNGFCVAASDRYLYAIGGTQHLKTAKRFDPSLREWVDLPPMNEFRRFAAAAVLDGVLYVMGGGSLSFISNSVECYDPTTNVWENLDATMRIPRYEHAACVIDGMIYVVGGEKGIEKERVEFYDPEKGRFELLNEMERLPRPICCCPVYNKKK